MEDEVAAPNGILVLTDQALQDFRWDAKRMRFTPGPSVKMEGNFPEALRDGKLICKTEKHIFIRSKEAVIRFDKDLEKAKMRTFSHVGALAAGRKTVFVAANSKLLALDEDLETLGELPLGFDDYIKDKDAHDILLDGNTACLLDNVVFPYMVFRVDVSNPARMKVVQQTEIVGVGPHLLAQWVDKAQDRWFVLAQQNSRSGRLQTLVPFCLRSRNEPNQVDLAGEHPERTGGIQLFRQTSGEEPNGIDIRSILSAPSGLWAVTATPDGQDSVLGLLRVEDRKAVLTPVWPILGGNCLVRGAGRWLFVAVDTGSAATSIFNSNALYVKARVLVIRCGRSPGFMTIAPLPDLQGSKFLDVLPY